MVDTSIKVGDRVVVLGGPRRSKVVEVRTGSLGQVVYVLADGGWMASGEVEPAERCARRGRVSPVLGSIFCGCSRCDPG